VTSAKVDSTVATVAGTETLTNKTLTAPTINGVLTANGGAVFNEASADVDFRVESDGDAHALFVEGSSGNVGIGTVPAKPLHVKTTADGTLQRFSRSGICDWDVSIGNTPIISGGSSGDLEIMPLNANMGFAVGRAGQTGINMRVRDGTLTLGSGIKFNSDTAAANELDDYEEGTWTPVLTGVASQTLGNSVGYYTKIGRQVFFQWYSSGSTIGTANGPAMIAGLPFTASSAGASYGLFQYLHGTGVLNSTGGYVNLNNTNMLFISENTTSASNFSAGSGKYIMIQGSYSVA